MHFSCQHVQEALAAVKRGWELRDVQQLSPRVAKLQILTDHDSPQQLILLQHSPRDRQRNPEIARDEFTLLNMLCKAGLPVPRPLLVETSPDIPFLITNYVDGEICLAPTDLSAFCRLLARILTEIHSIDINRHDLAFLPSQRDLICDQLRESTGDTYGIRAGMRAALPRIATNKAVLLHGDFWLGNLLWRAEKLAAIIDWEDAMLGDPLGDLGKSRLEMLWSLGEEAMGLYTAGYMAQNPRLDTSSLPFWDLWGALRLPHFANWTEDRDKVARMQARYEWFIKKARASLETLQK